MLDLINEHRLLVAAGLDVAFRAALAVRVIARRTPVSDSLAWLAVLLFVPVVSEVLYILIGENRLGGRRAARLERMHREVEKRVHTLAQFRASCPVEANRPFNRVALLLERVSLFPALGGNHLELIGEADVFLGRLLADIEGATSHVHLLYYIWDPDSKGKQVADSLLRAAARGVECRVLVDSVGSGALVASEMWASMQRGGVHAVEALPVGALRALFSRIDLRNHRKIAVIDGRIAYVGSHNITEENFRKRSGSSAGPWIDASVRVRGPAVAPVQATFLSDWLLDSEERMPDPGAYCRGFEHAAGTSTVHVVPSGPGPRPDAIHHAFLAVLYASQRELLMTTPYFVPDEATKGAIINAAMRGVRTTLFVPRAGDSALVSAAGRSHYEDLLEAGVRIYEHTRGLLHSKIGVVDGSLTVIGSANFDMRSFWLNQEVTLFVDDEAFASEAKRLHDAYRVDSRPLDLASWHARPFAARFYDNCAQLLGPLL